MPVFSAEVSVIKRISVTIEASDVQEARQKLNNLEFDPAEAQEVVDWKVSPKLTLVEESRPFGEPSSALDFY